MDINRTVKEFLLVRQEGNRQVKRNIDHYNLDMIIALGYRVQSQIATRFRRRATQRLHESLLLYKTSCIMLFTKFEIYHKREMDLLESDFDKEIKKLKDNK